MPMSSGDPQEIAETLHPGQPVFDANHEKVGVITALPPQTELAIVQQGWLMTHNWYIPFTAIDRVDGTDVHLNVSRATLQHMGWDTAPTVTLSPIAAMDTELTMPIAATAPDEERPAELTVPLHREELVATTRPVERGKARIHTSVTREAASVTAPVMREQIRVTRIARPNQRAVIGPHTFEEQDFTLPVMGEELGATKRAVVTDQVRIRKDLVEDVDAITDTVRRERIEITGLDVSPHDQHPLA